MGKTITLTEGKDFTMTALMDHLNKTYGKKRSGEPFNIRDVQQYIIKGKLPEIYGGEKIKKLDNSEIGIKVFRLSKK